MSTLSRFLPVPLKSRLRPVYQMVHRSVASAADRIRGSGVWPRPQSVKAALAELSGNLTAAELYRIGQREFGILQVEREITGFLDFLAKEKPRTVGEIGLKHGGNSFLFLRMFTEVQLYLGLDLVLANTAKLRQLARPGQRLKFLEGNSYAPQTVARVRHILRDRQFDFLFIDGDHSYDGVVADLKSYYSFVRPGGLIGFHDIVPDEVARFGKRSESSNCYGGEVYLLWKKLKPHFEHREFVDSWDQIGFGIGVIRKPLTDSVLPDDL